MRRVLPLVLAFVLGWGARGCLREEEGAPRGALPTPSEVPPPSTPTTDPELLTLLAAAGAPLERDVEVVLDRGRAVDDAWLSEAVGDDRLVEPAIPMRADAGSLARGRARLPVRWAVATIRRAGCGDVRVPYRVGALDTVLVPYPACGEGPPADRKVSAREVDALRALGVLEALTDAPPVDPDGPAGWVSWGEAATACAFWGRALPVEAATDEWTRSGGPRPKEAREESVGFRCVPRG